MRYLKKTKVQPGKFKNRIIAIFYLASVFFLAAPSPISSAEKGFPNYFQELVHNGDTQNAQDKLELALTSIIKRLQIPYFDEDMESKSDSKGMKTQGFFERIQKIVK